MACSHMYCQLSAPSLARRHMFAASQSAKNVYVCRYWRATFKEEAMAPTMRLYVAHTWKHQRPQRGEQKAAIVLMMLAYGARARGTPPSCVQLGAWLRRHDQQTAGIMGLLPLVRGMPVRVTQTLPDLKPLQVFNTHEGWQMQPEDQNAVQNCAESEIVLANAPEALLFMYTDIREQSSRQHQRPQRCACTWHTHGSINGPKEENKEAQLCA